MHNSKVKSFLIIQTAFIGDVILATAVIEKLHQHYPEAKIDFLLRKGNESLLNNHPYVKEIIVWDKKNRKLFNLFSLIKKTRKKKYDLVLNLHRFASSGFIAAFSGAKKIVGFDKNPFSFLFSKRIKHEICNGKHEIERNQELIKEFTNDLPANPRLYPSAADYDFVKQHTLKKYVCIAPTSVWFTKQLPFEKWLELITKLDQSLVIYLLGASGDFEYCEKIKLYFKNNADKQIINCAGKFTFLQSAALIHQATMNYVNDSGPLHLASAMNAAVTVFFCSTTPQFGFGPLSDNSKIIEVKEKLSCRPCGLHGHQICPEGHFKCGNQIKLTI